MPKNPNLQPLPEEWHRALAVVAHPDDMEFSAASAVARWASQGKEVVYLIASKGEAGIANMPPEETGPLRMKEQINAARAVGVETVEFLEHRDGVIEAGLPLRRDIARAIRRHRPEVLITSSSQQHSSSGAPALSDHRVVGLAAVDAARDASNRWVFPELLAEGLEPWPGIQIICVPGGANSTHGVDVTDFIDRGIASLKEHRGYLASLDRKVEPESVVKAGAEPGGQLLGCKYAVVFQVFSL